MRQRLIALLLGLTAIVAAAPCFAQGAFPQRTIKIIVPFAAGGNTDVVARLIAQPMSEKLGQQVIIENKTGGGSTVGSEAVAKASPDGYTLLLSTVAHAVSPALFKRLPFDPVKDFEPL